MTKAGWSCPAVSGSGPERPHSAGSPRAVVGGGRWATVGAGAEADRDPPVRAVAAVASLADGPHRTVCYVKNGGSGGFDGERALDEALVATVRRTGALAGGVYLLSATEPVLGLTVVCGLPLVAVAPWRRVAVSALGPLSEAVREDHLVWVGRQEDMARLYPHAAAGMPYQFALAFAPLHGVHRWGALVLVWSKSHPPSLTRRERGHILSSSRRITRVLDESPGPLSLPDRPRAVPLRWSGPDPAQAGLAAADLVQRLPLGALSLDLEGRITYLNDAAVRLLGRSAERLLGTLPWQALPWLDDPVHEEHYRTAVFSRESVAYTALRPPDRWLDFRLYPNDSGISALISPHQDQQPAQESPRVATPLGAAPEGVGTGRIHQLIHLAAALSQTVTVADVTHVVADRILPAFGARGMVVFAMDIGGDFYDLIRLSDTTAAAVIGDVQGHNITAAALMGQVRTAVHATAGAQPGEVLARTNQVLMDLETDLFVSCLYLHIDLAARRLHLASAGHPPPLLRSPAPAARTRVLEVEPGPLLGIDVDASYPVTTAPLPAGALLALYTDGLVETPGTDITASITALADHLTDSGDRPLDDLADRLVHAVPHRTRARTDDIALLLLRSR